MCVFIRNKTSIYCDHYHGIEIKKALLYFLYVHGSSIPLSNIHWVCTHRVHRFQLWMDTISGIYQNQRRDENGNFPVSFPFRIENCSFEATNKFHSISNQIKAGKGHSRHSYVEHKVIKKLILCILRCDVESKQLFPTTHELLSNI